MNALLDKDFVMGFLAGVGIAVAIKMFKDLIMWIRDRKGKKALSNALCKAALKRLATIFFFLRLSQARRKVSEEVYEIPASVAHSS